MVSTAYRAADIEQYFRDGSRFGVDPVLSSEAISARPTGRGEVAAATAPLILAMSALTLGTLAGFGLTLFFQRYVAGT